MRFSRLAFCTAIAVSLAAPLLAAPKTTAAAPKKTAAGATKKVMCPACKMALSPTKTKSNTVAMKVNGKTMYCCAKCPMKTATNTMGKKKK